MNRNRAPVAVVLVIVLLVSAVGPLQAQTDEIILQLAIPGYIEDALAESVIAQFEAEHPGVRVQPNVDDGGLAIRIGGGELGNIEDELADMEEQVRSADVLAIRSTDLAPEVTRAGYFLDLAPLVNSDPAFNPNNLVGNSLQQVQRDGQTWAVPLIVQPLAMRYDPDLFGIAGAIPPVNGWTVDEFETALRMLKVDPGDPAPFMPQTTSNTYLLMLIAAYGGLPMDYRTDPVTVNFTAPATIDAIRQVLDLAKNGYIDYSELASQDGFVSITISDDEIALYPETLSGAGIGNFRRDLAETGALQNTDPLTTFPQGTQYAAASYEIGAAYISMETEHAEACYHFIGELAQQPDLLTGMPARRSMINSPEVVAAQGADAVAFYNAMDTLMQQPNTIVFPAGQVGGRFPAYLLAEPGLRPLRAGRCRPGSRTGRSGILHAQLPGMRGDHPPGGPRSGRLR